MTLNSEVLPQSGGKNVSVAHPRQLKIILKVSNCVEFLETTVEVLSQAADRHGGVF